MFLKLAYLRSKPHFSGNYLFSEHEISPGNYLNNRVFLLRNIKFPRGNFRTDSSETLHSIVGKCEEQLPKKPVSRLSTDCRLTGSLCFGQNLLAICRPTNGRQTANCWPTDDQQSADSWSTDGRQSADRFFWGALVHNYPIVFTVYHRVFTSSKIISNYFQLF